MNMMSAKNAVTQARKIRSESASPVQALPREYTGYAKVFIFSAIISPLDMSTAR
jgi:hypothetical protein